MRVTSGVGALREVAVEGDNDALFETKTNGGVLAEVAVVVGWCER